MIENKTSNDNDTHSHCDNEDIPYIDDKVLHQQERSIRNKEHSYNEDRFKDVLKFLVHLSYQPLNILAISIDDFHSEDMGYVSYAPDMVLALQRL